jgi:hypothetical protein
VEPNGVEARLEETLRKWRTAEQRLYPLALAWPEGFQRHVAMVRAVADLLGSVRTLEALVDAYENRATITAAAAGDGLIYAQGLDLELAAGAAFYLRHREITSESRRDESLQKIAAAAARGDAWVVIDETRSPTGFPYPPWRKIEMHLPEGTGVHQWVEEILEGEGVEFGVELVALDPQTGRWLADAPVRERAVTRDFQEWKDAVARLKARAGAGGVDDSTLDDST